MDDLFSRESLNRAAKYLLIGVTILLVFFFLLAFLRVGIVYWLWSTVDTWVTVRLGLDYYAAQLLTMIIVSIVVAVLPTVARARREAKRRAEAKRVRQPAAQYGRE